MSSIETTWRGLRTGSLPILHETGYQLRTDKYCFVLRMAVFVEHLKDFPQIAVEFIQRFRLAVSAGKPGT